MSKRFKKTLMSLLAVALFVPQLWPAPAAEAATGTTGTTVVYDMQADAGISGAAVDSAFEGTSSLQNSGGIRSIAAYNGGKSIHFSTRTSDYNGLDVKLNALGLTAGVEYTFKVSGHVDNDVPVPAPSVIVFSNPNAFGSFTAYKWLVNKPLTTGGFDLEYKVTFTDADIAGLTGSSYFRVQTNDDGKAVPFYVDNIVITKAASPPPPNVVYDMQADTGISGAAVDSAFDGTTYLTNSGGTRSIAAYNGGKSIHFSARTNDYNGLDVKLNALGLTAGVEYTFKVSGHVDNAVTVPSSSLIVLSNPNAFGQFNNYQWLVNKPLTTGDFELEHKVTFTDADIAGLTGSSYFRVQTNPAGKEVPFYIDNINITKADSIEFDPIAISFNDDDKAVYEDKFTPNQNASIEWVNETGIGQDDDYALRGTHTDETAYTGSENAIRLTLPTPLPAGGIYSVAVSVYVPADGNEDKGTLTGPGIVLNADYAGATGVSKFPSDFGTIDKDTWKQLDITLPVRTSPVTSIDFRFVTNDAPNHPDVWYLDDIEIVLVGQQNVETPEWDLELDSLYEAYENTFLFGNAIGPNQIANAEFAAMVKHHYNVITAENDMKPQYMSPSKGVYNYTNADTLVNWALDNDIAVHGHTLVWHSQSADWLTKAAGGAPLTRAEAKENLIEYIENVAGHYAGKVISWDVANEVFADGGSFNGDWKNNLRKNDSPWYLAYANGADTEAGESGADYIYDAFVQTRLIDPDAILYYNDYNENEQTKREAIAAMVEEFNEKWETDVLNDEPGRLLIEGIGMQSHFNTNSLNVETVENAIKRFIETGAMVTVSELDITVGNYNGRTTPLTAEEKVVQAQLYAQLFQIYNKYAESIERVTIWGAADPLSWRAAGHPLLFDRLYAAKEAYHAVIDPEGYLAANPLPVPQEIPEANAVAGTAVIDGEEDQAWAKAPVINVNTKPNGQADQAATAKVRTLWDGDYLYVYADVADAELNSSSSNAWEQDSVEVFLSETMHKGAEYVAGDGQYRVTYLGSESFKSSSMGEGFESSVKIVDSGYVVEMKIPFRVIEPAADKVVGFDVQLNDASADQARKLTVWSDLKANGYNTTENWGELTLEAPSSPGSSTPGVNIPSEPVIDQENGKITIKPVVQVKDGVATANLSSNSLNKALEQATVNAQGKKQVTVAVPAQAGATSYEVQLPTSSLKDSGSTVLSIKTENGTIDLPGNMLAHTNVGSSESVSIRLGKASTAGLSDEVRKQIGDRPVINLEVLSGGNVVAWNNPNAPVKVSVPYTPTAEERSNPDAIVIWYIDGNGVATPVPNARYDAASGTVAFTTTHFSNYAVVYVVKTFEDLGSVPWALKAIETMASRDIIKGTSEATYAPKASIKRADFLVLLVRALELNDTGATVAMFEDVEPSDYYFEAVRIAKQLDIVKGTGHNLFLPNSDISRQDMMVLAARALKAAGKPLPTAGSLDAFGDAADVAGYARESVIALVNAGIVQGSGGKLNPLAPLTRAEAAVILYRIWNL